MTWLLWRQNRSRLATGAVLLAMFALAVVPTGVHMANVYDEAVLTCARNPTCAYAGNLFQGYGAIVDLVHLTILVPVVFGALGATLISREAENATNGLVWTQTVTRRRWLIATVAAMVVAAVLTSAVVSALVTWWSGTPNSIHGDRFQGAQFDTQNLVPVAAALFAVALGIAVGSLLRRTVPAIFVTVGAYVAVRMLVAVYLRPSYVGAATRSVPLGVDPSLPSGSWTLRQYITGSEGRVGNRGISIPTECAPSNPVGRGGPAVDRCLGKLGFRRVVEFQPASRYWHFQLVEAGLLTALAALLITVAVVHTLRRDA